MVTPDSWYFTIFNLTLASLSKVSFVKGRISFWSFITVRIIAGKDYSDKSLSGILSSRPGYLSFTIPAMEDNDDKKPEKRDLKEKVLSKNKKRKQGRTCWHEDYECSCWSKKLI